MDRAGDASTYLVRARGRARGRGPAAARGRAVGGGRVDLHVLRLRQRARARHVAVGRLRHGQDGLDPRTDPHALLSGHRRAGGPDPAEDRADRPHDRPDPDPPDRAGRSGPAVGPHGLDARAGRHDREGHDVDGERPREGLRDPRRRRRARRRPRMGRPDAEPRGDLRARGGPRVHPGGRRDLGNGLRVQPGVDRVQPDLVRRRRRVRRTADRAPQPGGLPARDRRGARLVADAGARGTGRRRADLRRLRHHARGPARGLQLRPDRRRRRSDLHRVQP